MIDIILTVNKEKVYEEVAKTTSYTGAKMDDELAYDRIFTTDEDKSMLERFWCESKNTICNSLKKMLLAGRFSCLSRQIRFVLNIIDKFFDLLCHG